MLKVWLTIVGSIVNIIGGGELILSFRIVTLTMNEISIHAAMFLREMVTITIWIC